MEILALILSVAGFIGAILPNLLKGRNMKLILFFLICANLFYALSYLAAGKGINGSAANFLGAVISGLNFIFESKGNPVPKWLVGIYFAVAIALQLLVAPISYETAIILGAVMAFLMCVLQPNGKLYRVWALLNISLWVVYDIVTKSYSQLLVHGLSVFTIFIGMIIHDRKKSA